MKLKVGLLGGGSWGTTVASLTAKNSSTIIWARNPKTVEEINEHHTNEKYLPNAKLTTSLKASNSIKETVEEADVIVMGVPAQSFRKVLEEAKPAACTETVSTLPLLFNITGSPAVIEVSAV